MGKHPYGTRVNVSYVPPPAGAFRANGFMSIGHVKGHDGRRLELHNIVFIEGGQIVWVEDDLFCVLRFDRTVDSYNGEWVGT